MKKILSTLIAATSLALSGHAEIVKQWTFNSPDNDFLRTTGSLLPSNRSGTPAKTIGGVGNRFGDVQLSATTDPASVDNNTMWRIGTDLGGDTFPAATENNKTTGVEFHVNSSGYGNLQMTWDQENSASASKYWRVQYTTNGVEWLDHSTVISNISGTAWQLGNFADFSATPGVNNNPNFGVRLVSEFEFTATGTGTNAYVGNAGGYGVNGTLWLDMVTITGDDLDPGNQFPQVSSVTDYSTLVSNAIPPFAFTISDDQTAPDNLTLAAFSSEPSLISSFSFDGTGIDRTLTITPVSGAVGTAAITIRVTDQGGKSSESSFYLNIFQPEISKIAEQVGSWDVPITNSFSVSNLPGDPAQWVLEATSSNTNLVSDSGFAFSGTDSNRTVVITPQTDAVGSLVVTLKVSSEGRFATTNYNLHLLPGIIFEYSLTAVPVAAQITVPATTNAPGLTPSVLSRGATIEPAGLTRGFSANFWTGGASATDPKTPSRDTGLGGDYFEFSVTVESGFSASFASFQTALRRSAINAPMNFELLYSFDGFATPGITVPPHGPIWTRLGFEESDTAFTYFGRSAAGTTGDPADYAYMVTRVDDQNEGNPIPPIDMTGIAALQNVPAGTTITFRLIAWGNDATTDSNTVALGRNLGPQIRGTVEPIGQPETTLTVSLVGNNVEISWPDNVAGFLESSPVLPATWEPVVETPVQGGGNFTVTVPATGTRFFRLNQ